MNKKQLEDMAEAAKGKVKEARVNVKEAKCDVKKAKGKVKEAKSEAKAAKRKVKEAKGIGRGPCVVVMNDKDNRRYTRPS